MSARDTYHQVVINALKKEGWTITHDPFMMSIGRRKVYVDLGASVQRRTFRYAIHLGSGRSAVWH